MSIHLFFSEECEKVFQIHKTNLINKTSFTEKNRCISAEDYPKFNQELESLQKQISKNLTKLVRTNRSKNIQEILEPIANNYIKKFLNTVDLSKIEQIKN
jgi:hypothetical protein